MQLWQQEAKWRNSRGQPRGGQWAPALQEYLGRNARRTNFLETPRNRTGSLKLGVVLFRADSLSPSHSGFSDGHKGQSAVSEVRHLASEWSPSLHVSLDVSCLKVCQTDLPWAVWRRAMPFLTIGGIQWPWPLKPPSPPQRDRWTKRSHIPASSHFRQTTPSWGKIKNEAKGAGLFLTPSGGGRGRRVQNSSLYMY